MASISPLYHPCNSLFTSLSNNVKTNDLHLLKPINPNNLNYLSVAPVSSGYCRKEHVLCCNSNSKSKSYHTEQDQQSSCCFLEDSELPGTGNRRREALLKMAFAAFTFPAVVSNASAENEVAADFRVYKDDVNKFQISIPQEWQIGAGDPNGFKSVTAFYPEEAASSSNVSVVITGLGPDFTKLESFGKVDEFAETLVSGLDRSWKRPPGVAAKLINCKSAKGFYYIDYTLQNPGESRKHLFSALGIAFNGWYNRLYTVTGQFVDEEAEKYGAKIQKAVSSFKFI